MLIPSNIQLSYLLATTQQGSHLLNGIKPLPH